MIPSRPMCRETRKLLEDLESLAKGSGITTLFLSKDVYCAEQMVLKYYENPMINLIKSRLRAFKNKSSKHFTPEYWVKIIDTSFSNNTSVLREEAMQQAIVCEDFTIKKFDMLSSYLLTDYSIMDAKTVMKMCHTYESTALKNCIDVAKGNNVYNINYVKAVIEREQAVTNIKKQGVEELGKKADTATKILDKVTVVNNLTDIATASYNWEKALENAEIERQMREAGLL